MQLKQSNDTLLHAAVVKLGGRVLIGPKDIRDAHSNKSLIIMQRLSEGVLEIKAVNCGGEVVAKPPSIDDQLQAEINKEL